MNYSERLRADYQRTGSLVCMGMDPVIEKIPLETGSAAERIFSFYEGILEALVRRKAFPSCVKPNYAFYARYGSKGIDALVRLISLYKDAGLTVILDVKRGDIGSTAEAYAEESFDFFKADAVTLSPYMGFDSVEPFIKKNPDAGYYILCRTSNKSGSDMQNIMTASGRKLYLETADLIASWNHPGIGAVTGATYPRELSEIIETFTGKDRAVPLLIPGIGTQGGDLAAVLNAIKSYEVELHRINASSSINYAYLKRKTGYADAAAEEILSMNESISALLG